MKDRWRLDLQILDSEVSIASDDSRLFPILHRLWEPFIAKRLRTPDVVVAIEARPRDLWAMIFDDEQPILMGNLWWVLISIRNEIMLRTTAQAHTVVDLHAAAVARNGHALLLAGDPWSGKTTFSLRFAEAGWSYMSDDVAPIEHDSLRVQPFPKPIAIKTIAWAEMAYLWEPIPEFLTPPETIFIVPASKLLKGSLWHATPACIAFLTFRADAQPRIVTLSPAQALARCLQQSKQTDPNAVSTLRRLCERTLALELVHGGTESGVVELANHLVHLQSDVYAFASHFQR